MTLFAGADTAPMFGCLHDPLNLVGCGGFQYFDTLRGGSDLVCDPSSQWGLMGEADIAPGGVPLVGALFTINRSNGAQANPRPAGGRPTYSGLAYNGRNQLWGSTYAAGTLDLINPQTGIGAPTWMVPGANVVDLTSDECFSCIEEGHDVGDAPDSTSHSANTSMTAYPGVTADFPSVIDLGTGFPPGPFHRLASQDSWLGESVTAEKDADLLPDDDLVTNILPPLDLADRDGADDGVLFPMNLPDCQMTQFQYVVTVLGGERDRYTNAWIDFNRNGHWGEQLQCVDPLTQQLVTVDEWVVQDQLTRLRLGPHTVTTPSFRSLDPNEQLWMRINLGEAPAPPGASDGRGYDHGYEIGEVEDYVLTPLGGGAYEKGGD